MSSPVVKVESYRLAANSNEASENSYAGMQIHALAGLHQFIVEKAAPYLPSGAAILDVGAGSGAMSARLSDLGYAVSGVDIVTQNYRLRDKLPFYEADLNANFADVIGNVFDGLFAVEIIEHLENPRHFLRQCYQLLRPGGHLVLSTPNTDNPAAQALFLRTGYSQWFSDNDYVKQGHLTPLSQLQLRRVAAECKFDVALQASFGDPFSYFKTWPKMHWLAKFFDLLSATPKAMRGEVLLLILKKPN